MKDQEREFKGIWIPSDIWFNEELTPQDKFILMEIDSLDNEDHCFASNEYLAKMCLCSQSKVSQSISKLEELGYIKIVSFDGRQRRIESQILKDSLPKSGRQPSKNKEADFQNFTYSNIASKIKKENRNINIDQPNQSFQLNNSKSRKKETLFSKCEEEIYKVTENNQMRKLLKEYLQVRIKNEDKPLGISSWKGILKKLQTEFDQKEWGAVIRQSINRNYASFFPVSKSKKNDANYMEQLEGIPHDGRYDNENHTVTEVAF